MCFNFNYFLPCLGENCVPDGGVSGSENVILFTSSGAVNTCGNTLESCLDPFSPSKVLLG